MTSLIQNLNILINHPNGDVFSYIIASCFLVSPETWITHPVESCAEIAVGALCVSSRETFFPHEISPYMRSAAIFSAFVQAAMRS